MCSNINYKKCNQKCFSYNLLSGILRLSDLSLFFSSGCDEIIIIFFSCRYRTAQNSSQTDYSVRDWTSFFVFSLAK